MYQVVFDLEQVGFKSENFAFLLPGLVIVGLGLGFVIYRDHLTSPKVPHPMPPSFPFFALGFGILWTIISCGSLYYNYEVAINALRKDHVQVAEGIVDHFRPVLSGGHTTEQFCVRESDACFHYSDYVITPGFNQTRSNGGPMRDGLPVRVTYLGNTILRLEVGKSPDTPVNAESSAASSAKTPRDPLLATAYKKKNGQ